MGKYLVKVFVLEDDAFYASLVQKTLEKFDEFDVQVFKTGQALLDHLSEVPDIVTIDHYLPDMEGLEVLKKVKEFNDDIIPIFVSGQEDVEVVVKVFKGGARDYIVKKDNSVQELLESIKKLSPGVTLKKEVEDLREKIIDRDRYKKLIGESKPILNVMRLLQKVEKTDMMVLITGESGTGKEIAANTIHYNSPRKKKPFVIVNMPAIPDELVESELFGHEKGAFTGANSRRIGRFEEADKGTIFLDEIGDLSLDLQSKLLRVLQENTIIRVGGNKEIKLDVRVIAATNKDLSKMVEDGKFREDLYYRLQGFLIKMPPLRERGNDIILLARHFLAEFTKVYDVPEKTLSKEAISSLVSYSWPGNIRELKNVIERSALIADEAEIQADDLIFSESMQT